MWLVQNDHHEAAALLIECEYDGGRGDTYVHFDYDEAGWSQNFVWVTLSAPLAIQSLVGTADPVSQFDSGVLTEEQFQEPNPLRNRIESAFSAILRLDDPVLVETHVQLIVDSEGDWREHLREIAAQKGKVASNQARQFDNNPNRRPITVWNNLRFRSKSEVAIAQALDRRGVMYFPNCAARIGPPDSRRTQEPDFLICHTGKWGILEVDSPEFHPNPGNDAERDRQFKLFGVRVIERYQWRQCQEHADDVVAQFLALLEQA